MWTVGTAFGTQEPCRNYLKRDSALFLSLTVFFFFFFFQETKCTENQPRKLCKIPRNHRGDSVYDWQILGLDIAGCF
ncbi:hypothetical protein NC652_034955 [Populus alba x Populus x berolinensis]|nr:hypothetical protein NC652_034955 [Populus alba x Populus x berolinensis]